MDAIEQRLKTPEYKNWIKGTLAIIHICEAVRVYTKHVFEQFKDSLPDGNHFTGGFNAYYMCGYAEWQQNGRVWNFTKSCRSCKQLFDAVVSHHLYKDERIGFSNGVTKQVPGCWGIAKIFMPKHYEDVETPEDTDPYALFHMIMNCNLFLLNHSRVDAVINARNKMMHSKTNTLTDQDVKTYINAMTAFLKEASTTVTGANASTTRSAIDKAQSDINALLQAAMNIDILTERAKEALTFKKDYIRNSLRIISVNAENTEELKNYIEILEKLGGELQFWNRHPWEIRKIYELNELRDQLETANREKEKLQEDLKKAQKDLEDVQKKDIEMKQFQKELDELRGKVSTVSEDIERRKKELSDVQVGLGVSAKQKETIQEQLSAIRNQVVDVEKENNTIKTELKVMNEETGSIKKENEKKQEILKALQERVGNVNEEHEKIKGEIDQVKVEFKTAKEEGRIIHENLQNIRKKVEVSGDFQDGINQTDHSKFPEESQFVETQTEMADQMSTENKISIVVKDEVCEEYGSKGQSETSTAVETEFMERQSEDQVCEK